MNLSPYQSQDGTWNAKKRRDNNPLIYGAIAKYLGMDISGYNKFFKSCVVKIKKGHIEFTRLPGVKTPPPSPEEMLGALVLGLIPYSTAKANHFMFNGKGKPAKISDLEKIATGLLKLYMAHQLNVFMPKKKKVQQRNLFWKYKIEELYGVAYRLNPAFVYAVKKANGVKPHEEERLLWKLYIETTLSKRKSTTDLSQIHILWVLANYMGDKKLAKKCKVEQTFPKYFGSDHDFTKKIKGVK